MWKKRDSRKADYSGNIGGQRKKDDIDDMDKHTYVASRNGNIIRLTTSEFSSHMWCDLVLDRGIVVKF